MGGMKELRGLAAATRMLELQKGARAPKAKAAPPPPSVIPGIQTPGAPGRGLQSRVTTLGRRLRGDPAREMLEAMPEHVMGRMSASQKECMLHALRVLDGEAHVLSGAP